MRPDFGKVIIERPRRGSSCPSAKARWYGRIIDTDDGPDYDGMTRLPASRKSSHYHPKIGDKDFTDVLGPLRNFLRSSCGRHWNDVYSDIAHVLGSAGWAVRHIITAHLEVAVHTYRGIDGNVWYQDKHGVSKVTGGYRDEFYVEPETGILRQHPDARKRHRPRAHPREADRVDMGNGTWGVRINGLWFFGIYTEGAAPERRVMTRWGRTFIEFDEPVWPHWHGPDRGSHLWFTKTKSCSKKEIKQILERRIGNGRK